MMMVEEEDEDSSEDQMGSVGRGFAGTDMMPASRSAVAVEDDRTSPRDRSVVDE